MKKYKEETQSNKIQERRLMTWVIFGPSTDKAENLIKSLNLLIQKLYILIKGDYKDDFRAKTFF